MVNNNTIILVVVMLYILVAGTIASISIDNIENSISSSDDDDYNVIPPLANWIQTDAPSTLEWQSITSSSSGQYLAAVAIEGGIHTNDNHGSGKLESNISSFEFGVVVDSIIE